MWTGKRALKVGLIDILGGLPTAINKAKELAKIGWSSSSTAHRANLTEGTHWDTLSLPFRQALAWHLQTIFVQSNLMQKVPWSCSWRRKAGRLLLANVCSIFQLSSKFSLSGRSTQNCFHSFQCRFRWCTGGGTGCFKAVSSSVTSGSSTLCQSSITGSACYPISPILEGVPLLCKCPILPYSPQSSQSSLFSVKLICFIYRIT